MNKELLMERKSVMHKKKSFVNQISRYLLTMTGLMVAVLGIFLVSSYTILENEIQESSEAFLTIYSNEVSNTISKMNSYITSITTQGEGLAKIKSANENERSLSAIALHIYMQDLITDNQVANAVVVYDANYQICLDVIKTGFNYIKKNKLREFTIGAINNDQIHNYEWDFLNLNEEIYMYKMLINDNRAIAIYSSAGDFLNDIAINDNGNRSILLVNKEGEIGKIWGNETRDITFGGHIRDINQENYYIVSKSIESGQFTLYCCTSKNSMFKQIDASTAIVAIVSGVAFLFMLFVLWFTRKEIALPMHVVVNDMERIKEGEYENRIEGNFNTKEFQMLQETTNKMVDEIVGLKIQTYEKRIELQDMELKSIRLQLKPHFFLNALTTISSLSSQNKNGQIKAYIDSLAKNIRYMFRTGFHTVPIKEEIRHVENYFEIQELKYPGCVFYLINLPQELEDWKIPQMLIHTFIENTFKHSVSMDETRTLLIKMSKQRYNDEDMLLIEIEDDGKGYPQEVLDYMNGQNQKTGDEGMRIGLWSVKRMMELMYEQNDLVQLDNIDPHGCLNRIYVPRVVAHERTEVTGQTKL